MRQGVLETSIHAAPIVGAVKCPRCWCYHHMQHNYGHSDAEIAANPALAGEKLCDACQHTILTHYPEHESVPHIKQAMARQLELYSK